MNYPAMSVPVGCLDPECKLCTRPEARYSTQPPSPWAAMRWAAEIEALIAFLDARERKQNDGNALQAFADREADLTALLRLTDGLDRAIDALQQRLERYKRTCDIRGAAATGSALELVRQFR